MRKSTHFSTKKHTLAQHPILGRLALPIAMLRVMVKCTKIYKFQPTINWCGEVKNVCKPLYKIVIPKRVRK